MYTCGTSVVPDGVGGLFVGATYAYDNSSAAPEKAGMPRRASFVARLDGNAREVWSQALGTEDRPVSLAALPGGRVAVSGRFSRGDSSAAGLAVLDSAGHQEWLVLDEGQRGSPYFPVPVIAARESQIMWAGRFSNKATFGQIAIDPNAGCSFVVAFGAGGRASSSSALPSRAYCEPDVISVGEATWVAGRMASRGTAAFVQRVPAPLQ